MKHARTKCSDPFIPQWQSNIGFAVYDTAHRLVRAVFVSRDDAARFARTEFDAGEAGEAGIMELAIGILRVPDSSCVGY